MRAVITNANRPIQIEHNLYAWGKTAILALKSLRQTAKRNARITNIVLNFCEDWALVFVSQLFGHANK